MPTHTNTRTRILACELHHGRCNFVDINDPFSNIFAIICSGFGTGSNGAYLEQIDRITKWDGDRQGRREMIINMEFGAFDNERKILPFTKYDTILDKMSLV